MISLTILLCKLSTFEKIDSSLALVLEIVFVAKEHVSCLRSGVLFHFVEPVLHSLERLGAKNGNISKVKSLLADWVQSAIRLT